MKTAHWLIAALMAGTVLALPQNAKGEESIRVMSFNIRYNNPDDGINAWPNRKERVAAMISGIHNADLAGLQEVLRGQLEDLVRLLPEKYSWIGVGRDDGRFEGEYSPVFFDQTRFELLATNTFWLSETPEAPGSVSWDSSMTRIVSWGKFRDKETNTVFFHFNTHFDHRGREARVESAKLLRRKIDAIAGAAPVLVTGDFNARETSEPYAVMTGDSSGAKVALSNARRVSKSGHKGPTSTSNDWEEHQGPDTIIDYIFVGNGIEVLSHAIADDKFDGRYPSDHLPVLAEIVLP